MTKEARTARRGGRPSQPPTVETVRLTREAMAGLWTLRFGLFGCRDDETQGGILHIEGDRMAGGDGFFVLHGRFDVRDGGIDMLFQAIRYQAGSRFDAIYDQPEPIFPVAFRAEAISRDHLEGRIQQPGYPDMRIVMRRFGPLARESRLV